MFVKKSAKLLLVFLIAVLLCSSIGITSFAKLTDDGYVEIRTPEDLYNVRKNMSGKYRLMNDIDMTASTAQGGEYDFCGNGWDPIGSKNKYSESSFSGILDGNGYKIIGLRMNVVELPGGTGDEIYVGLFSEVSGTVMNLTLEGGSLYVYSTKSIYAGAVAAKVNGGKIVNVINNMPVTAGPGYIGRNESSGVYAGGITAWAEEAGSRIFRCANNGAISISGSKYEYSDSASYNGIYGGGICGFNYADIKQCYNTGKILVTGPSSAPEAGGIAGRHHSKSVLISDCYNTGDILYRTSISDKVPQAEGCGISGTRYESTVRNCYSVGRSAFGITDHKSVNCYYLTDKAWDSFKTKGLDVIAMTQQSSFKDFDFTDVWMINDSSKVHPYPQFIHNPQDPVKEDEVLVNPFSDVADGKWYTQAVLKCYNNGYMAGISKNVFGCKETVTRAMFVTILAKIDGGKIPEYTQIQMSFTDVPAGRWYSNAIEWASRNGYAAGVGNDEFGRNTAVSREQIALFLYTYSQKNGIDVTSHANLWVYEDDITIHSWAFDAVEWAVAEGLINGTSAITLSPRASATRAEMSLIIMNYVEKIVLNKGE